MSSEAIAVPMLKNIAGIIPDAEGAEKTYDYVRNKSCDIVISYTIFDENTIEATL